jgi:hypothetical protein
MPIGMNRSSKAVPSLQLVEPVVAAESAYTLTCLRVPKRLPVGA